MVNLLLTLIHPSSKKIKFMKKQTKNSLSRIGKDTLLLYLLTFAKKRYIFNSQSEGNAYIITTLHSSSAVNSRIKKTFLTQKATHFPHCCQQFSASSKYFIRIFSYWNVPETCLQISPMQPSFDKQKLTEAQIMQSHFNSSKLLGRAEAFDSRAKRTLFGSPIALSDIKSPPAKQSQLFNKLPTLGSETTMGSPINNSKEKSVKSFRTRPLVDSFHKDIKTQGNPEERSSASKSNVLALKTSARTESTRYSIANNDSRLTHNFRSRKDSVDFSPLRKSKFFYKRQGQTSQKSPVLANQASSTHFQKSTIERNTSELLGKADSQHRLKRISIIKRHTLVKQSINNSNSSLTNSELLSQILQTIEKQPHKYGLLDSQVFREIRISTKLACYTEENKGRFAIYLMDYMKECQNRSDIEATYKANQSFLDDFSRELYRFRKQVQTTNKNVLHALCFLLDSNEDLDQFFSNKNLKFDLSIKQMIQVANRTKIFCAYDERAFIFFSNYMYLSLLKIEHNFKTIGQLDEIVKNRVEYLIKHFSYNQVTGQQMNILKNYKSGMKIVYDETTLGQNLEERIENLTSLIIAKAEEATLERNYLEIFMGTLKTSFFTELKITSEDDIMSIYEVIQKICPKEKWQMNALERQAMFKKEKKCLKEIIETEEKMYVKFYNEVYRRYERHDRIIFNRYDFLKGVIRFKDTEEANNSVSDLIKKARKDNILIDVQNKLASQTNPELKLRLKIGKVLAQIHATVDTGSPINEFLNKLTQIMGKSLNPITALKIMNQNMTNKFMIEAKQYINHYSQPEYAKYIRLIFKNSHTFQNMRKRFNEFEEMINWKDPHYKSFDTQILQKRFMRIVQGSRNLSLLSKYNNQERILRNNADYYINNKQYSKAKLSYRQLFHKLQSKHIKTSEDNEQIFEVCMMQADIIRINGQLKEAVPFYEKSYEYLLKVTEGNELGSIHLQQRLAKNLEECGQYDKAIKVYESCLVRLTKIDKIDSEEGIYILNNIANLQIIQRKSNQALKRYDQSLKIIQRANMYYSHAHLTIMKNMSNLYGSLRNHNESMACIVAALEIEMSLKGKGHVEKITSHNLMGTVHQKMGNYDLAIQLFDKEIEIQEQVRGKDTLISLTSRLSKAATLFRKGLQAEALKEYNKSMKMIEKREGKTSERYISVLEQMADQYMDASNFKEAQRYYLQCYELQSKIDSPTFEQGSFLELVGTCHQKMGEFKKAEETYIKVRQIYKNMDYESQKEKYVKRMDETILNIQKKTKSK